MLRTRARNGGPRRRLPRLPLADCRGGEQQVYGATAGLTVQVSEAEVERKSARFIPEWLRVKRGCLQLESQRRVLPHQLTPDHL